MNNLYRIVWTSTFTQDYEDEYEYSLLKWGHSHANNFFDEINQKIESLVLHPYLNLRKPDMLENVRYFIHREGLYIFYLIDEDNKEIRLIGALGKNRIHNMNLEIQNRLLDEH